MRVITLNSFDTPPALREDLPAPTPAANEVLVRVHASSVNPVDNAIAAGMLKDMVEHEFPEDEQYLRDLGVSDVLPRDGDIAELVRERYPDGVDPLLDLVSYAPGAFDAALKAGARVVSPNGAAGEGAGRTNVMAVPSAENLQRLGALLAGGSLRVPVQATYELAQALDALGALAGAHTQGKLAIQLD